MSIIEHTTKLQLTQFEGSSIKPAILDFYSSDMLKIDDAFSDMEAGITQFEADVTNRVDALDTLVNGYDERITTLEGCCENVNTTLTNYGERLDSIEEVIETVSTANIEDLIRRIDALEQKVDANTQNIDTLNTNLIDAVNDINALTSELATTNANLASLGNRVSTLESCCEEVRTTLADHNARINTNATNISALDARLTRDETNIAGNASDITILATQNNTQANQIQDLYDRLNDISPIEVSTETITAKGLTLNFIKKGGWCIVDIAGILTSDIVDENVWDESIPTGYKPLLQVTGKPNVPTDITNSTLAIEFMTDGSIQGVTANSVTIQTGASINCSLVYPCE